MESENVSRPATNQQQNYLTAGTESIRKLESKQRKSPKVHSIHEHGSSAMLCWIDCQKLKPQQGREWYVYKLNLDTSRQRMTVQTFYIAYLDFWISTGTTNRNTWLTSLSTPSLWLHSGHGPSCTDGQYRAPRDHPDWDPSTSNR